MRQLDDSLSYSAAVEQESSRILFEGAVPADLMRVLSRVEEETDWISQWRELADAEEAAARAAREQGWTTTARERYIRAAYYTRLAHYFLMRDCDERNTLVAAAGERYRQGILDGQLRIEAVKVPYGGRAASGYLHLPVPAPVRPSCVVCIPGLGHTKESMHAWCTEGTRRGLAVFTGDGPGYGDARALRGERLGFAAFDDYLDGVLTLLAQDDRVDGRRVGLLGDCFGGLLSLRAASRDQRFKACALVQAILDDARAVLHAKPVPPLVLYHMLESDLPIFRDAGQHLAAMVPRIRCPVYVIHAETDELIPIEIAQNILARLKSPTRLEVVPGAPCYANWLRNHYNAVLDQLERCVPSAFDWLAKELAMAEA
jgi:dienelactone hydrolase